MTLTYEDLIIAAKTIWGESRSETKRGKLAVAHVLLNRWRSTTGQWAKDDTLAKTCLRPWQFSAWNSSDPNLPKMQKVDLDDKLFRECMIAVLEAYDNSDKDPTWGSCHYITTSLLSKGWPRSWGPKKNPVVTIGVHAFFNNVQ
jgi:hypothetical protein